MRWVACSYQSTFYYRVAAEAPDYSTIIQLCQSSLSSHIPGLLSASANGHPSSSSFPPTKLLVRKGPDSLRELVHRPREHSIRYYGVREFGIYPQRSFRHQGRCRIAAERDRTSSAAHQHLRSTDAGVASSSHDRDDATRSSQLYVPCGQSEHTIRILSFPLERYR